MELPINEFDDTDVLIKKPQFQFAFAKEETKHEYEYQEVCSDIEKDFGKLVWTLPYKVGFTPYKIKEAANIARRRGITKFPYLVGIIKRL